MRSIITFLLLGCVIPVFGQDKGKEVTSKIEEVTVFLRGAQVTRTARVSLNSGINKLRFTNLSPNLDPNSIQINLDKKATILSVNKRINHIESPASSEKEELLRDKIEALTFQVKQKQDEKAVLAMEAQLLNKNLNLKGTKNNLVIEDLMEMADYYRTQMLAVETKTLALQKEGASISKEINSLNQQLREVVGNKTEKTGEVILELKVDARTTAKVSVDYYLHEAGWMPIYDVRSDDINGPVELTYKAQVYQNSGFDWEKVKLKIATGNPNKVGTQPTLTTWKMDYAYPEVLTGEFDRGYDDLSIEDVEVDELIMEEPVAEEYERDGAELNLMKKAKPSNPNTAAAYTSVVVSTVHVEFDIKIPYTIPTDGKVHEVEMRKFDLPVTYNYYAAPRYDPDAFLLANVSGWEALNLLTGKANIYYQGTYVGQSSINANTTLDTLKVSMGRDQGIVIERKKIKEFSKTTVVGANKKTNLGFELNLRNSKTETINLLLEDQIPLSRDKQIVVDLIDQGEAMLDEATGKLTWKVKLLPGESKTFRFKFSVKYPKNMPIQNL